MEQIAPEAHGWSEALQRRWFVWAIIPLIWILGYWPALGVRDLRLEEGRRATPAAEMVASHQWIVPTLYGEPYLNKPPLFFWAVAAVGELRGKVDELAVRIPSLLSVLAGAWLLCGLGKRAVGKEIRVLAALILMAMPIMLDKGTLGEIDALLSVLVFAAVAALWWGLDRSRIRPKGWLAAGILLGLAGLLKGPPGLIEFYGVVIPFLILTRRWKNIFSPWHLIILILALAPMAIWVWGICASTGMTLDTLLKLWENQLGIDALHGSGGGSGEPVISTGSHYAFFALRVIEMLLPWILLAAIGFWKRFGKLATLENRSRDFWILLAAGPPALLLIFWAWPAATPRHMMMVALPVSALAALVMATPTAWRLSEKWLRFIHVLAGMMAVGIAIVGLAALVLATSFASSTPAVLLECTLVCIGAIFLSILAVRWTLRTPLSHAGLAFACTLALLIIIGRGAVSAALLPHKATTDPTRLVRAQLDHLIPPGEQIYTTRTISEGRGDNYYNVQFYLPNAQALRDPTNLSKLPANQKVIVICTPDEVIPLELAAGDWKELGRAKGINAIGDLVVVEIKR